MEFFLSILLIAFTTYINQHKTNISPPPLPPPPPPPLSSPSPLSGETEAADV